MYYLPKAWAGSPAIINLPHMITTGKYSRYPPSWKNPSDPVDTPFAGGIFVHVIALI